MTISATIPTRHNNSGNDSATSFSYTVKISATSYLKLVHTDGDGVETVPVLDTDYTVNGAGDAGGGTVDFPKGGSTYSTLATGEKLAIIYAFPIEQTTDLPDTGRIFNESVEDQLDYMTVLINAHKEKFDRAVLLTDGSTLTNLTMPEGTSAANRKNKFITWNDDGDDFELGSSVGTNKGNWATATAYNARDIVKDTDNNNIYWCNTSHTSTGSQPISSNADVAKWDLIVDAASATASAGAVAYKYTFNDSTSMADPTAGLFRLNHATIGSVTAMAIDDTTAASGNPDISAFLVSLDDGTNTTHYGYVTLRKDDTPATFAVYSITGLTDNSGWVEFALTHVASNGSWTDADDAHISFARTGNRGNDAGLDMTFESTTTDTDQGAGKTWLNNATPASATVVYMDDADANGANINSYVDSWDDSTSTINGAVTISKQSDVSVFALYNVTGAVTDATGYSKVAVTYVTGAGSFTDADPVNVQFTRTGDKGEAGTLSNVVEDTTPQLGGDLDVNGRDITSPDGTDLIDIVDGAIDIQTNSSSRLDFSDTGVRLGGANARVTTVLDEDAMGSDSATALATQQSIKAYVDADRKPEALGFAVSDETTALTTGAAKATFRMPYAFTLTDVRANVTTAPTGATILVDINESGSTILSTKIMIDATEKTSTTAATPAVISDTALADDAQITIDIDQIGSSVAGAGLKIYLIGTRV